MSADQVREAFESGDFEDALDRCKEFERVHDEEIRREISAHPGRFRTIELDDDRVGSARKELAAVKKIRAGMAFSEAGDLSEAPAQIEKLLRHRPKLLAKVPRRASAEIRASAVRRLLVESPEVIVALNRIIEIFRS